MAKVCKKKRVLTFYPSLEDCSLLAACPPPEACPALEDSPPCLELPPAGVGWMFVILPGLG